ncbi:hypothetical protein [Streptomyces sp. BRA346]|uniref:hypothetical protein n=1 Tax=Streptomyces sp. BRA346 TaxID=2878199 RepID=UPI004062813C
MTESKMEDSAAAALEGTPDPAWMEPTEDQVAFLREEVAGVAADLAGRISTREQQLSQADAPLSTAARGRLMNTADWQLSLIRALREVKTAADGLADGYAKSAGAAGANYPQLGAAWGITRQSARSRWPGVVSPRSGADRESVALRYAGGDATIAYRPEDGAWWYLATGEDGSYEESDTEFDTSTTATAAATEFLLNHKKG